MEKQKKYKKHLSQNFLVDTKHSISLCKLANVSGKHVLEIGCGNGAITKQLLVHDLTHLCVVEIDEYWINKLKNDVSDARLTCILKSVTVFDLLSYSNNRWTIAASIPFHITHAILLKIIEWKSILDTIVLLVQEEVGQKLVKTRGRDYTVLSLCIQHHFECELHDKVHPSAFYPRPKVHCRIIKLTPKIVQKTIIHEDGFWKFAHVIFKCPRRTIKNNIASYTYAVPEIYLSKRAQEFSYAQLVDIWNDMNKHIIS